MPKSLGLSSAWLLGVLGAYPIQGSMYCTVYIYDDIAGRECEAGECLWGSTAGDMELWWQCICLSPGSDQIYLSTPASYIYDGISYNESFSTPYKEWPGLELWKLLGSLLAQLR